MSYENLAPTKRKSPMKDILKKFCSIWKLDERSMRSPFSYEQFTYATDKRVMIRIPRIDVMENKDAPNMRARMQFTQFFRKDGAGINLPALVPQPRFEVCYCMDVIPDPDCDDCDGVGKTELYYSVLIGDKLIGDNYLRLLSNLNSVLMYPHINGPSEPMPFTFLLQNGAMGGEGLLMPRKS